MGMRLGSAWERTAIQHSSSSSSSIHIYCYIKITERIKGKSETNEKTVCGILNRDSAACLPRKKSNIKIIHIFKMESHENRVVDNLFSWMKRELYFIFYRFSRHAVAATTSHREEKEKNWKSIKTFSLDSNESLTRPKPFPSLAIIIPNIRPYIIIAAPTMARNKWMCEKSKMIQMMRVGNARRHSSHQTALQREPYTRIRSINFNRLSFSLSFFGTYFWWACVPSVSGPSSVSDCGAIFSTSVRLFAGRIYEHKHQNNNNTNQVMISPNSVRQIFFRRIEHTWME